MKNRYFLTPIFIFSTNLTPSWAEEKKEGEKNQQPIVEKTSEMLAIEIESQITTTRAKIEALKKEIEQLIEEARIQDSAKRVETNQAISRKYHEKLALINEYEKLKSKLAFSFPDRGKAAAKRYRRIEVQTLEELEKKGGIAADTKRVLMKVRAQYKTTPPEAQDKKKSRNNNHPEDELPDVLQPKLIRK
ncbi:MAG: hypothetical protein N2578_07150 [Bdellovibrionaceae bacterium]|nr:hypothetical protein [Pseudobdellovibrionaceae bacterium]